MKKVGISLGYNCAPAIYGVQNNIRGTKQNGYLTCPFDEMVTNLSGLIKCIDEDFKYFHDENYLIVKNNSGDNLIHNTRYNFYFNHESPGHANLYIEQNWPGGINHYIDNNYNKFKERYTKRINHFLNYINNPNNHIVFILTGYKETNHNILRLKHTLNTKYPHLSYEFLFTPVGYYDKDIITHYGLMGFSDYDVEWEDLV